MIKVSEYLKFKYKYDKGEFNELSLGRAFIKYFVTVGESYLYYEKNNQKAIEYIKKYKLK